MESLGSLCFGAYILLVLVLVFFKTLAQAQTDIKVTRSSVELVLPSGNIPIYPRQDYDVTVCDDAVWKSWSFHRTPPVFNPLHWTSSEWREYLVDYPLHSAGFSVALLLIGLITMLLLVTWRCVQWCVGCGRCGRCRHACSVGAEETDFLGDTKHTYLKVWIYVLLAGALSMAIWGMVGLNKRLLASFWAAVLDVIDYGNAVTEGLSSLETQLTLEFSKNVTAGLAAINNTLEPGQIQDLLKAGFGFVPIGSLFVGSLTSNASAIESGLDSYLLPGLEELGTQLGVPVNLAATSTGAKAHRRQRRRLAQSGSSSPASFDTLDSLLPALKAGLPRIESAETDREGIQDNLQALQDALNQVLAEVDSSPTSPAITALREALAGANLTQMDQTLADLATGLQAYNASRSGPVFAAVYSASQSVSTGAEPLSQSEVDQMLQTSKALRTLIENGPYDALQLLEARFMNLSEQVATSEDWVIELNNGTQAQVLDVTSGLMQGLAAVDSQVAVVAGNSSSTSTSSAGAIGSSSDSVGFKQSLQDASSTALAVNASTAQLAAAASAAAGTASGGPDPSPALNQTASVLRPSLNTLTSPTSTLDAALGAFLQDPTEDNLATLRRAALDCQLPLTASIGTFAAPLVNASELARAAKDMERQVEDLEAAGTWVEAHLASNYSSLAAFMSGALEEFQQKLGNLSAIMAELPNSAAIEGQVMEMLNGIGQVLTGIKVGVQDKVSDAGNALNDTATKLQEQVLDPGESFIVKNQATTEDIVDIVYPVWMSCWALFIFLVVLLALGVALNWPAGLVTIGLLLLIIITVSQVMTAALSFGMSLLDDACTNVEQVAMTQVVQYSSNPQVSVLLSYYLYKVPDTRDVMLEATFGFSATEVAAQLVQINQTITDLISQRNITFTGLAQNVITGIRTRVGYLVQALAAVLLMMSFENIHGLYVNTKISICCDAGNFAFNQWCAITAAACICYGALIPVLYLLGRMDMLRERRRKCCSCCDCVCYRPHNRYNADMDAEDELAKEARKQQELFLQQQALAHMQMQQQQQQQYQQQPYPPQPYNQQQQSPGARSSAASAASGLVSSRSQHRSAVLPVTTPPEPVVSSAASPSGAHQPANQFGAGIPESAEPPSAPPMPPTMTA